MRLCFSGLEKSIEVLRGTVTTVEVHNHTLFERMCRSLLAADCTLAVEPFVLCNDEGETITSNRELMVVESPFSLPWNDRALGGKLATRMIELLHENPELSDETLQLARRISTSIAELALQLQSDYCFECDWDVTRYLKAFGFGVESDPDESIFENCIRFISLAHDTYLEKTLVFFNLKLFLSESEVNQLAEHVFMTDLPLLLMENTPDKVMHRYEAKYVIDQHFLEKRICCQTKRPSLSQ